MNVLNDFHYFLKHLFILSLLFFFNPEMLLMAHEIARYSVILVSVFILEMNVEK